MRKRRSSKELLNLLEHVPFRMSELTADEISRLDKAIRQKWGKNPVYADLFRIWDGIAPDIPESDKMRLLNQRMDAFLTKWDKRTRH